MNNQQIMPVQVLQGQPGAVPASALFGLPGISQWTEQKENLDGTVTTFQSGSQVDVQFASNFKQTDVVFQWQMEVLVQGFQLSTVTNLVTSAQFPYNVIGPFGLNFQNQFDTINMPNAFIAGIMQMFRPAKMAFINNALDQNPSASNYSAEQNQVTNSTFAPSALNPANYVLSAASAQTYKFTIDLLPGLFFNLYYDLEEDGRLYTHKMQPIKAWVSPQLMSGTNRVITPRVRLNQGVGTGDSAPAGYTSAPGTLNAGATATLGFRRKAVYQPAGINDTPPIFNWQYSRDFRRFSLSGVSSIDLAVPQIGQILMLGIYMWDPTLNTSVGGPIPITNVTECDLIYGSGLFKFQDKPIHMQRRLLRQHGLLPPEGTILWDMAITDDGLITNSMALNTLTTSGCTVHIDFTGTQSNTAYCFMFIEALRYVAVG